MNSFIQVNKLLSKIIIEFLSISCLQVRFFLLDMNPVLRSIQTNRYSSNRQHLTKRVNNSLLRKLSLFILGHSLNLTITRNVKFLKKKKKHIRRMRQRSTNVRPVTIYFIIPVKIDPKNRSSSNTLPVASQIELHFYRRVTRLRWLHVARFRRWRSK